MTAPVSSAPSTRRSRRAMLAGVLGGLGAWAVSAVGRASPVRADGETVTVGSELSTAETLTSITNQSNGNDVFAAESTTGGRAIYGKSYSGAGLEGESTWGAGVSGISISGIGVLAFSNATGQPAVHAFQALNGTAVFGYSGEDLPIPTAKPKTGVYGEAHQDSGSRGVWGRANAGRGVYGQATTGVGGYFAASGGGFALQAAGRTKLSTSGVATIAAGETSRTVTPGVVVTSASFVLLTPRANIGSRALWFTTNATNDTFTIRMSSSRSSGTKVAWLLLG
ncbi:MAG TPA: hypothetical protein VF071_09125 [Candidatus Limnocylindria bacterium]